MTQYYRMPGFSLANANASTKVLVSLFLLCVAGGLGVALLQYADRAGFSALGATRWIRGDEPVSAVASPANAAPPRATAADEEDLDGLEPDLGAAAADRAPGEPTVDDAREQRYEKSYRELLQLTHDHAFSMPMLLFILLHLVALCATIGERTKITLYLAGFASLAGSLAGPWLVHFYGPAWTLVLTGSGVVLLVTIAASCTIGLFELWLAKPLRRLRRRPEPPAPDPLARRRGTGRGADGRDR